MSIPSLADRVRANRKSRRPFQDTAEQQFDEITNALAQGGSYRTIYGQLVREGHNVGSSHTSLFAAYKAVKARRGETPSPASAPYHAMPDAIVDDRRKTTDWK